MDLKTIWEDLGNFDQKSTWLVGAGCTLSLALSLAALAHVGDAGLPLAVGSLKAALLSTTAGFLWDLLGRRRAQKDT